MKIIKTIIILSVLVLLTGCSEPYDTNYVESTKIPFESKVFEEKIWNKEPDEWTYTEDIVPDAETAVGIADAVSKSIKKGVEIENFVEFDTEDEVWVITCVELHDGSLTNAGWNIAIQKSNGKVLRVWFGE